MRQKQTAQFYTIRDISEILNTDYRLIAKRITSGEIPHYKIGKKTIRVRVDEFEKWLKDTYVTRNTMG
jgi:excisionase family DNA binding protein